MRGFLSHKPVFSVFRFFISLFLKRKFNYEYEKYEPKNQPFIVLANHNTNYDPLMVGLSFPKLIYYVASDHIFRWGLISKIIQFLVAPIPRIKAVTEVQTVRNVLERLKEGSSVCVFAEGNRSFTGETGHIPESTGKLIKLSGVALITYRLDGGYFTSPRWAKTLRRGIMKGYVVKEYSPEELKTMTAEEINEAIKRDLYVNAYEDQLKNPVAYKGKRLAEHLETALYICPNCNGISTLKSNDNRFYCTCGLDLRYTPYGFLESLTQNPPPFKHVLGWSRWQRGKIAEIANEYINGSKDGPVISDSGQSLWKIDKANKSKLIAKGTSELYRDKLVFKGEDGTSYTFVFSKLHDMAIYSHAILIFSTTDRESFEIKSDHPRSAVKYLDLYKIFKNS
ncbi:MAG: 1-acyl-sn-glycerol-3-phosphate acyltransferase [Clostridiaceae bacterium]|nr:1-acyl-sn-glycerol-3-phosphate acyltransferase [Clostridiaceae bacterium]